MTDHPAVPMVVRFDRVGPPLRHAFSPQSGRVSRRTLENA
ncbi:hypothetical protein FHS23_003939 [Prauserella isguenensis]|uniref:Uncharacterized protein n=1 Tax=Prauserella isguenensis TaxID=1470180 RepID=A0A839S5A4_9PSEU|nr:hypothetical protein [Prauserella isguenensis]